MNQLSRLAVNSVTRFGEISPFGQNFKSIWPIFMSLQNFEPTLKHLLLYWANFHCCKWPKIEKLVQRSGHTGREQYQSTSMGCTYCAC